MVRTGLLSNYLIPGIVLSLATGELGAVPNDQFAAASDLGSVESVGIALDTTLATRQVGEPIHGGSSGNGTTWWRWTAPADGLWTVEFDESFGSSYQLAVYTGSDLADLTVQGSSSSWSDSLVVSVEQGREYRLVLANNGWSVLETRFTGAPSNDDFASRIDLGDAAQVSASGTTVAASREDGEPNHADDSSQGPSIWWEWTASEDGIVRYNFEGSDSTKWVIGVYEGSDLETLEEVGRRSSGEDLDSDSILRVNSGARLMIAAARSDLGVQGEVTLNIDFDAVANNDDRADAVDLGAVMHVVFPGDTTGATAEDGEILPSIWWKWTPAVNGLVVATAESSGSTTVYPFVYRELPDGTLDQVHSHGHCRAGESFLLRVEGYSKRVTVTLEVLPAAVNDEFSAAAPLVLGRTPFDLANSGPDPGQPMGASHNSLWWRWTAPGDGALILEQLIQLPSLALDLYHGVDLESLVPVASPDYKNRWEVTGGETYTVAASSATSYPTGLLQSSFVPKTTGNDHFADAIDLGSGWSVSGYGSLVGATVEPNEPGSVVSSLWWNWTAPADAIVYVSDRLWSTTSGGSYLQATSIYHGDRIEVLGDAILRARWDAHNHFEASAGETYRIAVGRGVHEDDAIADFALRAYPHPVPNDAFSSATDLGSLDAYSEALTFVGATLEAGEPDHDPVDLYFPKRTRWWRWTAPADLNVEVRLHGGHTDRLIGVYQGSSLPSLAPIVVGPGHTTSHTLRFAAEAGQTYHLVLDGGEKEAEFTLRTWAPPAGDRFDAPVDLGSGAPIKIDADMEGSTSEIGDPVPVSGTQHPSRWWHWTAPSEGLFEFSELSLNYGTWTLFQGTSLDSLEPIGDEPRWVTTGERIGILYQGPDWGIETVRVSFHATPGNDDFAAARDLGSIESHFEAAELYASSLELGEPALLPDGGSGTPGSLWWKWTAPANGVLRVLARYDSSSGDEVTAVLRGTAVGSLEVVAIDDDFYQELEIPVTAGEEFVITTAVSNAREDGDVKLTVEWRDAPANDQWIHAFDLGEGESGSGAGTNEGALVEAFEGDAAQGGSVWWTWVPPWTGSAVVMCDIVGKAEVLQVYRGDGAGGLVGVPVTPLALEGDGSAHGVAVTAGERLWFSVAGSGASDQGAVDVVVQLIDRPANDEFAGATALPGDRDLVIEGSFAGALAGLDDPVPFSGSGPLPSLWWEWTAPEAGFHRLSVSRGEVAVFTGESPESLSEVTRSASGVAVWDVSSGETYRIMVVSTEAGWGSFTLHLEPLPDPANDGFADRIELVGGEEIIESGYTIGATAEAGEPLHGGIAAAHSVWYEWTAGSDAAVRFSLTSELSDARVAVYTGSALAGLVEIISGTGPLVFLAEEGASYRIAVDAGGVGTFSLEIGGPLVPVNDAFAGRIVLDGWSHVLEGEVTNATREPNEPPYGNRPPFQTLWWEWTAPSNAPTTFRSIGGIQALIYYFESPTGVPTPFDTPLSGRRFTSGTIYPRAGYKYYFQMGTSSPGRTGDVQYELVMPGGPSEGGAGDRPPNDDFGNRISLGNLPVVRSSYVDVRNATNEDGESIPWKYRGLWWTWTAPADGYYVIRSDGSRVRKAQVHTGSSVDGLSLVREGGYDLVFAAEAGTEYQITLQSERWSDQYDNREERLLGFDLSPADSDPANDDFAAREDLDSTVDVTWSRHNVGAGAEPGEPDHGGEEAEGSVWFEWTAPTSGGYEITVYGAVMRVGIYEGVDLSLLTPVASDTEPFEFHAEAGTTYQIAVDSSGPYNFRMRINAPEGAANPPEAPVNDHFAAAAVLTGAHEMVSGSLAEATVEPGEAQAGGSDYEHSVWWSWTAPADGPVSVSTSAYLTIAAYTGDVLDDLHPLIHRSYRIRFAAVAGTTYRIAVSGSSPTSAFDLEIDQDASGPSNDGFQTARELSGTSAMVSGTTEGASWEDGEPSHSPESGFDGMTVWYRWDCPVTGWYDITHTASGYISLAVYTGDHLSTLNPEAFGEDEVRIFATAGTSYHVVVAESGAAGPFTFSIEPVATPDNDDFANRTSLGSATGVPVRGTTVDATRESGEPLHGASGTPGGSIWWSWTASGDGTVYLDANNSENTNNISVYAGDDLGSLVPVAGDVRKFLGFEVVAGTTYQIAVSVSSASGSGRDVEFVLTMGAPVNDLIANRIPLPLDFPITASGTTLGAGIELGEPRHGGAVPDASIWWEWTSPVSGQVDLIADWIYADVYTGEHLAVLERVEGSRPGTYVRRFEAVAGTTYQIALATTNGLVARPAAFELRPARELPPNDLFANATMVAGDSVTSTSHNWGAGTEAEEPFEHTRSLWWRWTAPRTGKAVLHAGGVAHVYRGDSLGALEDVPYVGDYGGFFVAQAGEEYRIALSTSPRVSEVVFELEMGPVGDYFEDAIPLLSGDQLAVSGDLSDATWEELEPWHVGRAAQRSLWFRWTADATQRFRLATDAFDSEARIAVYRGDQITRLIPVSEGEGEVLFQAEAGLEYRFVLDVPVAEEGEEFELGLVIAVPGYADWQGVYFGDPADPAAMATEDPDGDGLKNILEYALGKNPLVSDCPAVPIRMESRWGFVVLSVERPQGIEGIRYSFEVSRAVGGDWYWTGDLDRLQWVEDNGDGTETFRVLLSDFHPESESALFARLRVEFGQDPLE